MTKFEDGPAKGQKLMLTRAPYFLRVVEANGQWDALDQLTDVPSAKETIYAYQIHGEFSRMHVYFGGGKGGWYVIANYRVIADQPTAAELRDNEAWQTWCQQHAPAPFRTP